MPDIISQPTKKRKILVEKKCQVCKTKARWYKDDRIWTEYGNTEGRCPGCGTVLFLGRFGFKDTY